MLIYKGFNFHRRKRKCHKSSNREHRKQLAFRDHERPDDIAFEIELGEHPLRNRGKNGENNGRK